MKRDVSFLVIWCRLPDVSGQFKLWQYQLFYIHRRLETWSPQKRSAQNTEIISTQLLHICCEISHTLAKDKDVFLTTLLQGVNVEQSEKIVLITEHEVDYPLAPGYILGSGLVSFTYMISHILSHLYLYIYIHIFLYRYIYIYIDVFLPFLHDLLKR